MCKFFKKSAPVSDSEAIQDLIFLLAIEALMKPETPAATAETEVTAAEEKAN